MCSENKNMGQLGMPKTFTEPVRWWNKVSVVYAFSHPHVRLRLEKLMGSNLVRLTDRNYMQRLMERILEDYADAMDKRIRSRESDEMERIKDLVLTGKIPMDQAPPEMANHPIILIEHYCRKLIAERRAKIKVPKVYIPTHLYWDDTPDPPSGLSIEKGHIFRRWGERLCQPPERWLIIDDNVDIQRGYMFNEEEYESFKYTSPIVTQMNDCTLTYELYAYADRILGELKAMDFVIRAKDSMMNAPEEMLDDDD